MKRRYWWSKTPGRTFLKAAWKPYRNFRSKSTRSLKLYSDNRMDYGNDVCIASDVAISL